MKEEILYSSFLEEIVQKIPQKSGLVNVLSDMLCIGKEAVYRRLRRDVPFTFYEVMTISRQLDISLDKLQMDSSSMSKPFELKLIEFINPAESDFALMGEINSILESLKNEPEAEGGEITSILPQPLYIAHDSLFKFYLFKWKYQSNSVNGAIPYKDIFIVDKLRKIKEENVRLTKNLHTDYIFDNQLFHNLYGNIKYFYNVGLITKEEIKLIQEDLLKVLDEIESWARAGVFKETGKKINIFISTVNIETSYVYINAPNYQLTILKAFLLNGIASTDKKTFDELTSWILSIKRQSILITGSGEIERFNFLAEQRKVIESLSQL